MAGVFSKGGLSPTANVQGGSNIHLFKEMRNVLKLSAESMKEARNSEKRIKKNKYIMLIEKYTYETFAGIEKEHYEEFIEELKDKFDWDDGTEKSLLGILKMDDAQIHESVFGLMCGGVGIQYSQMCAEKNGEKINLAIAKYELIYLKDFVSKISMTSMMKAAMSDSEDGFFDIIPTMTEEEKDTLRLWGQCKLFKYVDEKCKSNEA